MLVSVGSANAWTSDGYGDEMRATITEMDAHYSEAMKTVYAESIQEPRDIKARAAAIQLKWTSHREKVVREMRQVYSELKSYEERQLNSNIRIRAKLQQTLGEIQQWRNLELGRIQTLVISADAKANKRMEIDKIADAQSKQIQMSAITQEIALRQLNERADRQMFSAKQEVSSFALKHSK